MTANKNPIPKRLKQARIATGLSQKRLGIMAGIDEFSASARMNQYEVGKHTPDFLTLRHISRVLQYPVAFFYAEDDELAELIYIFQNLSKQNKKKLLSTAKSINI